MGVPRRGERGKNVCFLGFYRGVKKVVKKGSHNVQDLFDLFLFEKTFTKPHGNDTMHALYPCHLCLCPDGFLHHHRDLLCSVRLL